MHKTDMSLTRSKTSWFLLLALAAAFTVNVATPSVAGASEVSLPMLAQFDSPDSSGGTTGSGFTWQMPFKIIAILIVMLATAVICYFGLFRLFLDKPGEPIWPRTLWGRLTAVVWFVTWMVALGVLWYDLPIERPDASFLSEHGMRVLLVAIAASGAVCWAYLFKSSPPSARREPDLVK